MRTSLLIISLIVAVCGFAVQKEHRKQLAGPPSEFHLHNLPEPSSQLQKEDSAFFEASLALNGKRSDGVSVTLPLLVDSATNFAFAIVSKYDKYLDVFLNDPNGAAVDVDLYATQDQFFPIGDFKIPTTVYILPNPIVGVWNLTLKSNQSMTPEVVTTVVEETEPNVAILLWLDKGFEIYTHLSTYFTHEGSQIGLVATTKNSMSNRVSTPAATVTLAVMDLTLPSGAVVAVKMKDDATHPLDTVANDGIFVGTTTAAEAGTYKAQAVMMGEHSDGRQFVRTTQHLINVVEKSVSLTGHAYGHENNADKERMVVRLVVEPTNEASGLRDSKVYRAYSQVWGTQANGSSVAVAWISGITHLEEHNGKETIALSLDMNWAALAGAKAPFVLKNVYIQDPESQIPLSQINEIKLTVDEHLSTYFTAIDLRPTVITPLMRQGRPPASLLPQSTMAFKTGLILLHGYCSTTNPWQSTADLFTNGHYFLNPAASITNEQFAALVIDFGKANNLSAYAFIGHSQGGMVATHILNYYFTGLDNLDASKRLVQTVGTPFQGTTAAGSAANLAKSFGVACGSNFDLTIDGAKLWLSGISADTRENVYFYTTTYGDAGFFGDYCSLPMNMVLQYPNDGTTELVNAPLPGGNNMGNTKEWCHTADMKYKAQTSDKSRNTLMNKNAASN